MQPYLTEFQLLRDAGNDAGRRPSVIAYISTCWATNPCDQHASPAQPGTENFEQAVARITNEMDRYSTYYEKNGYTLQGVFLDEMSTQESARPFYQRVADHVGGGSHSV